MQGMIYESVGQLSCAAAGTEKDSVAKKIASKLIKGGRTLADMLADRKYKKSEGSKSTAEGIN